MIHLRRLSISVFLALGLMALAAGSASAKCYADATGGGQTCEVIPVPSAGGTSDVATSAKQDTTNTALGAPGDTACATDNGTCSGEALWKRIAQRLTTGLAIWPTTVDTNSGNKSASTIRVVVATDDPLLSSANPVLIYRSDTYLNIAAGAATTVVKSGAGTLSKVCINTKGASSNVLTVYDNTAGSGTKIAVLDTTTAVVCQAYDVAFATGLTVVSATGTGADLTIAYR